MTKERFVKPTDFHGLRTPSTSFKFKLGEMVLHLKSEGVYRINTLPDRGRLEETNEPAYSYENQDGIIFHRRFSDMEDGRFVHYDPKHSIEWHLKNHQHG